MNLNCFDLENEFDEFDRYVVIMLKTFWNDIL